MKNLFHSVHNTLKNMNKISKNALIFGCIPIFLLYAAAAFLYITAGRLIEYYTAAQLMYTLLDIGKELIGAVFVTSLIVELIDIATGKENEAAEDKKK